MATELYGYLIVDNDMAINTLPYETEDYKLLPGSIAFVIGGGAYILTPSYKWTYLNPELQKLMLPVFDGKASSGGGGGGGGNSGLVVESVFDGIDTYTLNKTWKEINDTMTAGTYVVITYDDDTAHEVDAVLKCYTGESDYIVSTYDNYYTATSENGYPSYASIE